MPLTTVDKIRIRTAIANKGTADNLIDLLDSLSPAEIEVLDGVTAGTATASKAVVLGASKEISVITTAGITNVDVGASGTAGTLDVFPTTASKGKLAITCTDQTGNTTAALVAGAMGQATTVTIPDPLAAAANVMLGLQTSTARTATADGLTTGTIAAAGFHQFITVTSADANHIIVLPTPTPGVVVILKNGATGYELRTSTPASISINGGSGASAESAIAANTMVIAVCTSATTWQAIGLAGTTLAAVEAAA